MNTKTIEEKAKCYDEAIERAKKWYNAPNVNKIPTFGNRVIEEIFPELKESEDEKIRKYLKHIIGEWSYDDLFAQGFRKEDIITWLEKQGEQKPADKVEPKFHEGDWVIDKQGIVHQIANVVENVTNHTYGYDIVGGGYFNDNVEGVRLWTLQDAKNGDVLATLNQILIFKETLPNNEGVSHCHYDFGCSTPQFNFNKDNNWYFGKEAKVYPATKEQRDLLFQKMKEAGYEWDAEKKELKKMEQKPNLVAIMKDYFANTPKEQQEKDWDELKHWNNMSPTVEEFLYGKQKPAWSEEDEEQLGRALYMME